LPWVDLKLAIGLELAAIPGGTRRSQYQSRAMQLVLSPDFTGKKGVSKIFPFST